MALPVSKPQHPNLRSRPALTLRSGSSHPEYPRNLSHLLFAGSLVVSAPVSASLYDWNGSDSLSTDVTSDNDIGTGSTPWRNILKLWFAQDDITAYFRMDLEGGPGATPNPSDPLLYGIYINADGNPATGASGNQSDYLYWVESVNEVLGVDSLIDQHYDGTGAATLAHVHFYDPTEALLFNTRGYTTYGVFSDHDSTAHSMEWSAPLASFGLDGDHHYVIYGATCDISNPTESFDLARIDVNAVPLPASVLLLAGGLLPLAVVRRRRRRVSSL